MRLEDILYEIEQMIYYTDDVVRIKTLEIVKVMIEDKIKRRNNGQQIKSFKRNKILCQTY